MPIGAEKVGFFAAGVANENYFGDDLNEDTSDDDVLKAVEDLAYLCEAVCEAVGLDESEHGIAGYRLPRFTTIES